MRLVRLLSIVALVSLAGAGAGAARADDPYAAALKRGRTLSDAGKHKEAIAAFDAALAARPDDPTALSELGWSAFSIKDYARAREATRKALAGIRDDRALKGATLYNLGRIEEAEHHPDKAVAAYKDSLEARPNPAVRARLMALAPTAAAEGDPLRPTALDGPFATLAEACKAQPCIDEGEKLDEQRNDAKGLKRPFLAVQLIRGGEDSSQIPLHLALRTAAGWFLLRDVLTEDRNGGENSHLGTPAFDQEPHFAGVGPQLAVGVTRETSIRGDRDADGVLSWSQTDEELVILCAIGASKTPSCTPAITLSSSNDDAPKRTWHLVARYGRGTLELVPASAGDRQALARDPEAGGAAGMHSIVFP